MATSILDRFVTVFDFTTNRAAIADLDRLVDRTKKRLDGVAKAATKMGVPLTAGAAAAVVTFSKYEDSLAKIEGLVGINRSQLDAWETDLRAISNLTGTGPAQLGDALFFITSAGLRGAEAMNVLRESARGTTAGLGETKTIADLLTSALNAYGTENLTAMQAIDSLTEAVRLGKLESTALAGAMGRVMPISSALGVQFAEVAGLMAAMSKTGTTAEESVTQLNRVMLTLLKPTDQAVKSLEGMGISFADLRAQAGEQGLWSVLVRLKEAFDGDNQALVEIFPNIRALRGIFDLLGPQMEGNRLLLEEMADSTGILDEAFGASERTIRHRYRVAMANLQWQLVTLGAILAPIAAKLLSFGVEAAHQFEQLPEPLQRAGAYLLALGPPLLAFAAAVKVIKFVLSPLVATFGVLKIVAVAVAGALGVSVAVALGLAVALLAIIAAGYIFRDQIEGFLDSLPKWAQAIRIVLNAITTPAGLMEIDLFQQGVAMIQSFIDGILSMVSPLTDALGDVLSKARDLLPFSDAKEGPFRDLTRSGRSVGQTFARGLTAGAGPVQRGVASILPNLADFTAPLTVGPPVAAAAAGGGGPTTIHVTTGDTHITIRGDADADSIAAELGDRMRDTYRKVAEEFDSRIRS